MTSARQIAFDILLKIHRENSYSNLILDSVLDKSQISSQNRSFVSALVYGVTERIITLDYQISKYLSQPIKKLKPQVLIALRMGTYQLLFMDKIPHSAAINESVKLVKNNGFSFASGLTNAVLHKIDKNGLILPDENDKSYFSVKYSVPEWLFEMWTNSYGKENAISLIEHSFGSTKTILRVNTLKTDTKTLIDELKNDGIDASICEITENSVKIENGAVHKTTAYKKGLFHVQDIASQFCCKALNVVENETVFDVCAAPGGKSFTLAQMTQNTGVIVSADLYKQRVKLIEDGSKRLDTSCIRCITNDAEKYNEKLGKFDKVLCDVPCSGLGVIRKKPEIRYKNLAEVDKLPDLQYSILCNSIKYLRSGGTLVYSTCSLNPDENENIVKRFLCEHDDYESVKVLPELSRYGENTDWISLMPHIHGCDGFFISAIRKV